MFTILRSSLLFGSKAMLRSNKIYLNTSVSSSFAFGSAFNISKTALIVLAAGVEDMEAVITTDVLRRGGINVTVAGLNGEMIIKGSNDVLIKPDTALESVKCNKYDAIVLPGGEISTSAMCYSYLVREMLQKQLHDGRIVAALCAAPMVLLAHCILTGIGRNLTSYPSFKSELEKQYNYIDDENVVRDCNLITSRGPGTTFEFALKLVEILVSIERRNEVAKGMLL